jgi:large subunit ribosomal protein L22
MATSTTQKKTATPKNSHEAKATLSQHRQSPRKVRLVADLVRGKNVERALTELKFTTKAAAHTIEKLIRSAVTNSGKEAKDLVVKEISVNEGVTMRRFMPVARGSAHRINKRTSHITVVLNEAEQK